VIIAAAEYPVEADAPALLKQRPPQDNQPTAYVCTGTVCLPPVTEPARLRAILGS